MIEVRRFKTQGKLIAETADLLTGTLSGAGNLMLSGGTSPYAAYDRLARSPCFVHPDRILFLSDERMVPFDSPQNNAGNLKPMLYALKCEDRFIRVETDLTAEEAATRYSRALAALGSIDLGLLGLGSDGHTAGIFNLQESRVSGSLEAFHALRPDGMEGVSVSPALLRRVERVILLVTGESKRDAVSALLNDPQSIPAGHALSGHTSVELWTDIPDLG